MSQFQKLTATEREEVRNHLYSGGGQIYISREGDEWFADVFGNVFEAETPGALLRELAEILEEV